MFKKIADTFKEFGVLNGVLYLLSRILTLFSKRVCFIKYYIYCQPVDLKCFPSQRRFKNISVFEITSDDKNSRLDFPSRPQEVIDQRFQQSARCFVAYKNKIFNGFLWFVKDRYTEDEIRCRYVLHPTGSLVWDFDVYVEPKARLGGTFLKLWSETFNVLDREGVNWSLSRISAFNMNSLRSHEKLGAYKVGSVAALSIFSLQILFTTFKPYFSVTVSACPDVHVFVPNFQK